MESDADRWPNYMEGSFLVCSEFHGFHRYERTTSFGVTNIEVDSDPKLPGACFACKWKTMAKSVRSSSQKIQTTVKQHIQMIQLFQNYGEKKTATLIFREVWMFYSS